MVEFFILKQIFVLFLVILVVSVAFYFSMSAAFVLVVIIEVVAFMYNKKPFIFVLMVELIKRNKTMALPTK